MKEIILIGGGGHCKSVIDVIECDGSFKIAGIVDKSNLVGTNVLGHKIVTSDKDLSDLAKKYKYALVSIGQIKSPLLRIQLYDTAVKSGFILPSIVSPYAYVSKYAKLGSGTIVMHHAIVNASASVGDNCIVNTRSLIEHDCSISNHCHISTNATINGGTTIESGCFIGSNATTKELVKITKNSFIKAGSLVV